MATLKWSTAQNIADRYNITDRLGLWGFKQQLAVVVTEQSVMFSDHLPNIIIKGGDKCKAEHFKFKLVTV